MNAQRSGPGVSQPVYIRLMSAGYTKWKYLLRIIESQKLLAIVSRNLRLCPNLLKSRDSLARKIVELSLRFEIVTVHCDSLKEPERHIRISVGRCKERPNLFLKPIVYLLDQRATNPDSSRKPMNNLSLGIHFRTLGIVCHQIILSKYRNKALFLMVLHICRFQK